MIKGSVSVWPGDEKERLWWGEEGDMTALLKSFKDHPEEGRVDLCFLDSNRGS